MSLFVSADSVGGLLQWLYPFSKGGWSVACGHRLYCCGARPEAALRNTTGLEDMGQSSGNMLKHIHRSLYKGFIYSTFNTSYSLWFCLWFCQSGVWETLLGALEILIREHHPQQAFNIQQLLKAQVVQRFLLSCQVLQARPNPHLSTPPRILPFLHNYTFLTASF